MFKSFLTPDHYEHLLTLAANRYSEGELTAAEQILRGLVALEPDDSRPWALMGSVLFLQGFRAAAELAYRRANALEPDDPYVLVALAELALDALRWADALPYLQHLFGLDPEGEHPAANRGRQLLLEARHRLAHA